MFIIFAITYKCLLRCRHCYVEKKREEFDEVFDFEKTRILIDALFLVPFFNRNGLNFAFHGGEPLLKGFEYYKNLCEYFSEELSSGKLIFSIQTSLFPLYVQWKSGKDISKWFDLFTKYKIGISSSYDLSHDESVLVRKLPSDFWKFIKEINSSFDNIGFITLVYNRKQGITGKELLDFFVESGVRGIRINCLIKHGNACNLDDDYFDFSYYLEVLEEVVDCYFYDGYRDKISVEPLEAMIKHLKERNKEREGFGFAKSIFFGCPFSVCCNLGVCSVSAYGDLMHCGESIGISEFKYTTLDLSSVENCVSSLKEGYVKMLKKAREKIEKVSKHYCFDCEFFEICQVECYLHNVYLNEKYGLFHCKKKIFEKLMKIVYEEQKENYEEQEKRIEREYKCCI